jgi:hypothetical protein
MNIGIARRIITPGKPVYLAGYGSRTEKVSEKYHDLKATAACFEQDGNRFVVLSADLLCFDERMVKPIKAEVEKQIGLKPEQVLLAATHTHYAPQVDWKTRSISPEWHPDVADEVGGKCVDAIVESVGGTRPATLKYGASVAAFGINRRVFDGETTGMRPNPRGVVDPTVRVLWAVAEDGKPFAVLFSYACHPTTAGGLMMMGGDYCGLAAEFLEEAIDGATAVPLPGCFGDIRPRVVTAEGGFTNGSLEVVRAFGQELCFAVLCAMSLPEGEVAGPVGSAIGEAHMPFAHVPDREELEARLADAEASQHTYEIAWARQQLAKLKEGSLPTHSVETVQALRIGDLAMVGLAGEVCVGYQLKVVGSRYPKPTFVIANSNAATSYVATADMFPYGGYEVSGNYTCYDDPSPLTPECEELILSKVGELLKKVEVQPC